MEKKWKADSLLHISKVPNIKLQGKQFTLFLFQIQNYYCILLDFGLDGTLFLCGRHGRVLVGWKERKNLSCHIWKNEIVFVFNYLVFILLTFI